MFSLRAFVVVSASAFLVMDACWNDRGVLYEPKAKRASFHQVCTINVWPRAAGELVPMKCFFCAPVYPYHLARV